jgi:hypothetical protein
VRQAVSLELATGLIQGAIAISFFGGLFSALLRNRKALALAGVTMALLGSLIGLSAPPPRSLGDRGVLGLDWHHGAAREAIDRNFAVHLPIIDRLFGTCYAPNRRWPEAYGIAGDPIPEGYVEQTLWPLRSGR